MSAPLIILASLPSFCQKLSKLVEIWQSSDKYKFAQFFFETRCILYAHSPDGDTATPWQSLRSLNAPCVLLYY